MSKQKQASPLATRLDELGISAVELAAIIRRPVEDVEAWIAGDTEPDGEARILLRVLDDDHVATLAAERVRHMRTLPVRRSEDWQTAAIEPPPYGSHDGKTGGQPQ